MLNIQENVTVEICVASEGKYIVGHLIDSGFVGRRKDAYSMDRMRGKK